jgi:hypothetical protein
MKRLRLAVLALAVIGCGSARLSGRFADARTPSTYIDFHPDGTIYAQDAQGSLSGSFKEEGGHVVVTMSNGHADDFTVNGNALVSSRVTLTRR